VTGLPQLCATSRRVQQERPAPVSSGYTARLVGGRAVHCGRTAVRRASCGSTGPIDCRTGAPPSSEDHRATDGYHLCDDDIHVHVYFDDDDTHHDPWDDDIATTTSRHDHFVDDNDLAAPAVGIHLGSSPTIRSRRPGVANAGNAQISGVWAAASVVAESAVSRNPGSSSPIHSTAVGIG